MNLDAYKQLIRFRQPVGTALLFWPCAWGLALAAYAHSVMPQKLAAMLVLFAVGAFCMRSAGCIINDMWDREFDREVTRTRTRPLASGALSLRAAGGFLVVLLLAALGVALLLPPVVLGWAVAALPLVVAYPLMKRITWWPQLFLGLTFNWGALMGYAAIAGEVRAPAVWLYAAGICWTLGYDTIYALQDRADDARIGVKSTARYFGARVNAAIAVFYGLAVVCLVLACLSTPPATGGVAPLLWWLGIGGFAAHLLWQIYRLRHATAAGQAEQVAGGLFRSNLWAGGWLALWLSLGVCMGSWLFAPPPL